MVELYKDELLAQAEKGGKSGKDYWGMLLAKAAKASKKEAEKKGIMLGKKEGLVLGKKEGFREATIVIAQNMIAAGSPVREVCQRTGLSKKDVLKLKK